MTPALLVGPLLRYADTTRAVVWCETSAAAEVAVLGRTTRTFEVQGHHYAHLVVDGLEPGTDQPYDVRLDGVRVWPPDGDPHPAPRLRTLAPGRPVELAFGSCRTARPLGDPWDLDPGEDARGVGVDALQALALSCARGERPLPDLLLLLGDQVYADEGLSPAVRERQRVRRPPDSAPVGEVADLEEYTWLYQESWTEADVRWLLSTVPSAMVFDDHDVRDDWNASQAWRHEVQQLPWWPDRITGAYASYWLYQHLGNLSPEQVEREGLLARVRREGAGPLLRFAEAADDEVQGRTRSCWSFTRDLGGTRLVVVDSRSGRVLEEGRRAMLSEPEWEQVEQDLRGDCDHLLVATSLPLVLERSLHDLERWDAALCAGAWGRRAARWGERLRQAADLEHWAAFPASYDRMTRRLGEVARGERGRAPASVLVLSGDVHHSYLAPLRYPEPTPVPVVQVVSSPLRNAFPLRLRRAFGLAGSRLAQAVGEVLVRSVGLRRAEPARGRVAAGPWYGNTVGTLRLHGRTADLALDQAHRRAGEPRLERVHASRWP